MILKLFLSHKGVFAGILLLSLLTAGCRTNKYIPEKEYLLSKVEIRIDKKSIDKNELRSYLKQKPNTKIFGFWRFHLGLYNLSTRKNDNAWLKRIGEAPMIYDSYLTLKTKEEFKRFLQNKGYYDAVIKDTTFLSSNGKAEVRFDIVTGQPYFIRTYQTVVKDDSLKSMMAKPDKESLIKPKSLFDSDLLGNECQRLLRKMQNEGFYKSNKNIFYFEADTIGKDRGVDVKLVVERESFADSMNQIARKNHQKYTFRNYYYLTEREAQGSLFVNSGKTDEASKDTLRIGNHYFLYKGRKHLKPDLMMNANHLNDRGFYSVDLVDRTYNEFFASRLFKLINIRFVETGEKDALGNPTLDCYIQLTPSMSQSYSASIEGTNSLGNFGVAGNLGYQHKNLFRGGEILDVQLMAGTQKQSYGTVDSMKTFNSSENGVDVRITVPKFIAPVTRINFFKYSTPQTFFSVSYNYQKTPDYTRTIARSAFGYQWKSSDFITHRINLIDVNLVKMYALQESFLSSIENLYIKSSYVDHSITSLNYSYIYSTQTQKKADYMVVKSDIETAGNVLYAIGKTFKRPMYGSQSGTLHQYHFLNTPFAQYFKFDLEFRKGWMDGKYNGFAVRAYGGAAFAYGNSDQIPFERKFFTGGANGIRAWPIRTLGPGTYQSRPTEFPNQSGDIRIEANAEYRFRLLWQLEGAVFFDMGNIWSIVDNRPGTEFRFNRFYKDIALCSGMGLRYDFTYVILRLDLGLKMHDPSLAEGLRWISPGDYLHKGNQNIVFAIGYPF